MESSGTVRSILALTGAGCACVVQFEFWDREHILCAKGYTAYIRIYQQPQQRISYFHSRRLKVRCFISRVNCPVKVCSSYRPSACSSWAGVAWWPCLRPRPTACPISPPTITMPFPSTRRRHRIRSPAGKFTARLPDSGGHQSSQRRDCEAAPGFQLECFPFTRHHKRDVLVVRRALALAVSDRQIRFIDALDRCSAKHHHLDTDTRAGALLYPFNSRIICTNKCRRCSCVCVFTVWEWE